jgi:hypothetical protein
VSREYSHASVGDFAFWAFIVLKLAGVLTCSWWWLLLIVVLA